MAARGCPNEQSRLYRISVGCANLELTAMLVYGVTRYLSVIVPRYGHRFTYVAALMGGVACWTGVRGILALVGRSGERGG